MIQSTLQRIAEMKEKVKVLVNEIEILRQEIIVKDRELTVSHKFFLKRKRNYYLISILIILKNIFFII